MINLSKTYPQLQINQSITNLKVTFFGVTSFVLEDEKTQILFDAMVSRPSILKAGLRQPLISNETLVNDLVKEHHLNHLKAIFISHSHYDHILDMPAFQKATGAMVYGSLSTKNVGLGAGVDPSKLSVFQPYATYTIDDFSITVLPSIHSKPNIFNNDLGVEILAPLKQPATMKQYSEGGSYDFYIGYHGKHLLVRPSCNYIEGSLENYPCDVLFLGIGGLSKLENPVKFYEETVEKVKPQVILPIHFDNFFLPYARADEAWSSKSLDTLLKINTCGIPVVIMKVDESITV